MCNYTRNHNSTITRNHFCEILFFTTKICVHFVVFKVSIFHKFGKNSKLSDKKSWFSGILDFINSSLGFWIKQFCFFKVLEKLQVQFFFFKRKRSVLWKLTIFHKKSQHESYNNFILYRNVKFTIFTIFHFSPKIIIIVISIPQNSTIFA